jgi:hypothetical protein
MNVCHPSLIACMAASLPTCHNPRKICTANIPILCVQRLFSLPSSEISNLRFHVVSVHTLCPLCLWANVFVFGLRPCHAVLLSPQFFAPQQESSVRVCLWLIYFFVVVRVFMTSSFGCGLAALCNLRTKNSFFAPPPSRSPPAPINLLYSPHPNLRGPPSCPTSPKTPASSPAISSPAKSPSKTSPANKPDPLRARR